MAVPEHRCKSLRREDLAPCPSCGELPYFGCGLGVYCGLWIGCMSPRCSDKPYCWEPGAPTDSPDRPAVEDAVKAWNEQGRN